MVTGVAGSGDPVRTSIAAVQASGVEYECRTTVHPAQLPPTQLVALARALSALGVGHYVLQEFRATGCQDDALVTSAVAGYPGEDVLERIKPLFPRFSVRRNH